SIVRENDGDITIGPDSVGYRISEEALVFGGKTMTTTDIAVRLGVAEIGNPELVAHIPTDFAEKAYKKIADMTEDAIDKMKTSSGSVSLVLVGGGSV
ncbi:hydantoinase/oxoprolinase family protein, partial [Listeria monocytogenes]|nr:hydantoinase/oxoprolinase family protein [Listeria monocytogenes]